MALQEGDHFMAHTDASIGIKLVPVSVCMIGSIHCIIQDIHMEVQRNAIFVEKRIAR